MAAGVVGARRHEGLRATERDDTRFADAPCRRPGDTGRRLSRKKRDHRLVLRASRHDAEAEAPGPHLAAQAGCVERPHLGPPCGEHRRDDLRAGFKPSPGGGNRIGPDTIRCPPRDGRGRLLEGLVPGTAGAGAARDVQEAERAATTTTATERAVRRSGLTASRSRGHRRGGTGDRDGDKDGPWAPCSPGHLLLELPSAAGPRRRSRARSDHGEHARPAASYEVSSASEE